MSLRSTLSPSVLNELKVQHLVFTRNRIPNLNIPRGFVRVQSELPNGTNGNVQVQFGGNRLAPENYRERQLQLANTLYLHRGESSFAFGTDNILTSIQRYLSAEQGGLFEFNSLDDLEAMRPASLLPPGPHPLGGAPRGLRHAGPGALRAGGAYPDPLPPGGGRAAVGHDELPHGRRPFNDILFDALGITSDRSPTDWSVSPRVQVTWDPGATARRSSGWAPGDSPPSRPTTPM
jgi:hypothetical protein